MKRLSKQERDAKLSAREKQLLLDIQQAFRNSQYPGDDHIIDRQYEWEWEDLVPRWKGRRWTKVPITLIVRDRTDLPFFTVEGFLYYLPAWLTAAVRYPDWADTLIDNLESHLTPPDDEEWGERFRTIASRLALPQKKVILEYLLIEVEIREEINAKYPSQRTEESDKRAKEYIEKEIQSISSPTLRAYMRAQFPLEGPPPEPDLDRAIRFWKEQVAKEEAPDKKQQG